MPKASTLQGNFNAGELSPLLFGRTDSPRYKQGLDRGLNYLPTLQGPLVRRPATHFAEPVKDSTKPPILIPFIISETQSYMLEFGDQYIRFYTNDGQVVTSGTTYKVTGLYGDCPSSSLSAPIYDFHGSRADLAPMLNEFFTSTSSPSSGAILEIASPYAYTDLSLIKWAQNNDVLYITHPNYPPYKLQFFGSQYWTIRRVYFQDGPYLPLNSYETLGDNTNVFFNYTTGFGQVQILTSVASTYFSAISGAVTDPGGSGQIQITTGGNHGLLSGMKVFVSGIAGTTEANNATVISGTNFQWTIQVNGATTFLLIGSVFVNAYSSGGNVSPAVFDAKNQTDIGRLMAIDVSGQRYWGWIQSVPDAAHAVYSPLNFRATGTANPLLPPATGSFVAATAWQMGVYSALLGFPSCTTFHQNRLGFSGSANNPQEVNLSYAGQYENFAASAAQTDSGAIPPTTALQVTDANALQFSLNSNDVNTINWMKSTAQALLAGSYTAEWAMSPSSTSEALTPTNFNAAQTSFFGSSTADAVLMGNAAIYIQRANRKVREMNFFFQVGTFRSTDMTELSEHITNPGITKLAVQKETQPLLWAIRSDGALLSMIYNRDDVSIQAGWTRHFLGGQSDSSGTPPIVQSIGVMPSPDISFDQLWMTVQRHINGANVIYVEYLTKIFDDLALQEDATQLDCGGTYDVPLAITGISLANPGVVTSTAHGLSNGNRIQIVGVKGLSKSSTDINGVVTSVNAVNYQNFIVANVTTNTFTLTNYQGDAIDTTSFGAYISGGQARLMVKTVSGLTWLEGETVSVLTDGGIHPDCVVSNSGVITLNHHAAKVQIGYGYKSQGKLLRVEGGAADGTSIGKMRRTSRAAFQMHRIGDISIGTDFNKLLPLKFGLADNQQADRPIALFSGIIREGIESEYDFDSQICFEQSSPLPGTIVSVTSFMEEQDV